MNLRKVKDSLELEKSIVFHSTASKEELADILLKKEFSAGRGGGKMLGPGFYANQHLYQAKKHNYGHNILKAQVFGIRNFLFCDEDMYIKFYGQTDNYLKDQFVRVGLYPNVLGDSEIQKALRIKNSSNSSAQMACYFWDYYGKYVKKAFLGFEYSGNWDKESIVCWYPEKCIKPLAVSFDTAETWVSVDKAKQLVGEDADSKKQALKGSEAVRSAQRAHDIIKRYEKYPDDKLAHYMNSHLSRIQNEAKREQRKEAFIEALQEKRPSVVDLLE